MFNPSDMQAYNISSSKEISDIRSIGQLRDNSVMRRNQAEANESGAVNENNRYKIKSGTADNYERPIASSVGAKKMSKTSTNLTRSSN
jgi:hypothetical protein